MPNLRDVRPTSHDRHDQLLVAALAAGDLAATDRVHATDLIETCVECATLHDDLLAIARATAATPPPIGVRPRDFRLTREQAGRLRPAGWRRVLGVFAAPRLAFTKPLGIGLTTIGLAGLLVGNLHLGLGSASSSSAGAAPYAAAAPSTLDADGRTSVTGETRSNGDNSGEGTTLQPVPAATGAHAPAASAPAIRDGAGGAIYGAQGSPGPSVEAALPVAGGPKATAPGTVHATEPPATSERLALVETRPDPLTLIFVATVLVGLGLLVLRRVARGVTST